MTSIALKFLAKVNPPTPGLERLDPDMQVCFMPLEAVWADSRLETDRRRARAEVDAGYVRFQEGDILCPKVTPTFQAGRSAIIESVPHGVGAATTEVHVLRVRDRVDARYVRYALLSKRFLEEGVSRFQGVAGLQRVPADYVRDFRVTDVPLDVQRRIADFLDDQVGRLDRAAALRTTQIEVLRLRLTASISQDFDDLSVLFGRVRLRHWVRSLGQGWSPECENREPEAQEWGVLRAGCTNGGVFRSYDVKALPMGVDPKSEHEIKPGDLLVNRASGSRDLIGSCAVVPDGVRHRLIFSDKTYRLQLRSEVLPDYVAGLWLSTQVREVLLLGISGAEGMANSLPAAIIKDVVLPRAPVNVQREWITQHAVRLRQWATSEELMRSSVYLLEERKRSLITAAVTGEFDVTAASSHAAEVALSGVGGGL